MQYEQYDKTQQRRQKSIVSRSKNVFTIFSGPRKYLAGMGCKARCAVDSPAIHQRRNAADHPTRHLPEGLGRNRAIGRPGCLHGHEPMRRIRGTHSSRLHSQRDLQKDFEHVLWDCRELV